MFTVTPHNRIVATPLTNNKTDAFEESDGRGRWGYDRVR